jgi:hypothetical protein
VYQLWFNDRLQLKRRFKQKVASQKLATFLSAWYADKSMKALLFYRPDSSHERTVIDYLREFQQRTGKDLPTVDVDTPSGIFMCETYDIVRYPTVLALDDQGEELQRWDDEMLPQINEVSFYMQDQ